MDFYHLGCKRIESKKKRMRNLLKIALPDEALYREIMLSLGYKNNSLSFLELATLLPYSEIRKLNKREVIERAMLFRAGFIDDRSDIPGYFDFSLRMMSSVWTYKETRPANFPEKRISQVSYLLAQTIEHGIYAFFKKRVEAGLTDGINGQNVKAKVNTIISFGGLGVSRKLDMFFNILVPFYLVIFEDEGKVLEKKQLERVVEIFPVTKGNKKIIERIARKYPEERIKIESMIEYFGLLEFEKNKNLST